MKNLVISYTSNGRQRQFTYLVHEIERMSIVSDMFYRRLFINDTEVLESLNDDTGFSNLEINVENIIIQ